MHAVFFTVKRAHLRILAWSRSRLVDAELTPARFDMMRIIRLHPKGVAQSKLCDLLGVSGATVSRMLKALERLDLVKRERAYRDRRRVLVRITEFGIGDVMTGTAMLLDSGIAAQQAAAAATGDAGAVAQRPESREAVSNFERSLGRVRRVFQDPCPFRHPWRTGELSPVAFTTTVGGRLAYGTEPGLETSA